MLPQVYWTVICEKEIDKHSRGGRGGALCLSPRTHRSSCCALEYSPQAGNLFSSQTGHTVALESGHLLAFQVGQCFSRPVTLNDQVRRRSDYAPLQPVASARSRR